MGFPMFSHGFLWVLRVLHQLQGLVQDQHVRLVPRNLGPHGIGGPKGQEKWPDISGLIHHRHLWYIYIHMYIYIYTYVYHVHSQCCSILQLLFLSMGWSEIIYSFFTAGRRRINVQRGWFAARGKMLRSFISLMHLVKIFPPLTRLPSDLPQVHMITVLGFQQMTIETSKTMLKSISKTPGW